MIKGMHVKIAAATAENIGTKSAPQVGIPCIYVACLMRRAVTLNQHAPTCTETGSCSISILGYRMITSPCVFVIFKTVIREPWIFVLKDVLLNSNKSLASGL